jgi:hypothetical protein
MPLISLNKKGPVAGALGWWYGWRMLWRLLQLTVFLAVIFSEIHYGWAHGTSGLAVAVIAAFAAFLVTALPLAALDLASKLKALLLRRHQRID